VPGVESFVWEGGLHRVVSRPGRRGPVTCQPEPRGRFWCPLDRGPLQERGRAGGAGSATKGTVGLTPSRPRGTHRQGDGSRWPAGAREGACSTQRRNDDGGVVVVVVVVVSDRHVMADGPEAWQPAGHGEVESRRTGAAYSTDIGRAPR
jgi:hypothetical protein